MTTINEKFGRLEGNVLHLTAYAVLRIMDTLEATYCFDKNAERGPYQLRISNGSREATILSEWPLRPTTDSCRTMVQIGIAFLKKYVFQQNGIDAGKLEISTSLIEPGT